MKIWAVSDIHIDYAKNRAWLENLSDQVYRDDILILAGDISDRLALIDMAFAKLSSCFKQVCYVPGNHDLWCARRQSEQPTSADSLQKFEQIMALAQARGIVTSALYLSQGQTQLRLLPLLSWYDYSFGPLSEYLLQRWSDFSACRWPDSLHQGLIHDKTLAQQTQLDQKLCDYFLQKNLPVLERYADKAAEAESSCYTITFSHFMPRIDIMPSFIPALHQQVYPVLGSNALDQQLRVLGADIHIYGHSHFNTDESIEGVRYINNAFAAPSESRIARKQLLCIWQAPA